MDAFPLGSATWRKRFAPRQTSPALARHVPYRLAGMLKITIRDTASELRLVLEGRLAGAWVRELRLCWQTAASTTASRPTVLDLREVDFVDPEGQSLLREMHAAGIQLEASGPLVRHMVEEIAGGPCGRVERKSARRPDALISSSDPHRRHPRPI